MEVKDAVKQAKRYITDLFKEEEAKQVGLEEIEYNEDTKTWRITVGFSRPLDDPSDKPFASAIELLGVPRSRVREMKVVTLDDSDGQLLSVKNRE